LGKIWGGEIPLVAASSGTHAIALVQLSTRSVELGQVNVHAYNFFVSSPKFTKFFFAERGKDCCRSLLFPIFDTSIHFRYCRQSLKLFKIALNFWCFCPFNSLGCGLPKIGIQIIMAALWYVMW